MRGVWVILSLCLLGLLSCHRSTPEEAAKETLKEALEALGREDFDGYLKHVDFGAEMDSAQDAVMRNVLKQHLGWRQVRRARMVSIDMVDARMKGDTLCTVYCQYTFADSTREVLAQKMVKYGEEWKMRLRN